MSFDRLPYGDKAKEALLTSAKYYGCEEEWKYKLQHSEWAESTVHLRDVTVKVTKKVYHEGKLESPCWTPFIGCKASFYIMQLLGFCAFQPQYQLQDHEEPQAHYDLAYGSTHMLYQTLKAKDVSSPNSAYQDIKLESEHRLPINQFKSSLKPSVDSTYMQDIRAIDQNLHEEIKTILEGCIANDTLELDEYQIKNLLRPFTSNVTLAKVFQLFMRGTSLCDIGLVREIYEQLNNNTMGLTINIQFEDADNANIHLSIDNPLGGAGVLHDCAVQEIFHFGLFRTMYEAINASRAFVFLIRDDPRESQVNDKLFRVMIRDLYCFHTLPIDDFNKIKECDSTNRHNFQNPMGTASHHHSVYQTITSATKLILLNNYDYSTQEVERYVCKASTYLRKMEFEVKRTQYDQTSLPLCCLAISEILETNANNKLKFFILSWQFKAAQQRANIIATPIRSLFGYDIAKHRGDIVETELNAMGIPLSNVMMIDQNRREVERPIHYNQNLNQIQINAAFQRKQWQGLIFGQYGKKEYEAIDSLDKIFVRGNLIAFRDHGLTTLVNYDNPSYIRNFYGFHCPSMKYMILHMIGKDVIYEGQQQSSSILEKLNEPQPQIIQFHGCLTNRYVSTPPPPPTGNSRLRERSREAERRSVIVESDSNEESKHDGRDAPLLLTSLRRELAQRDQARRGGRGGRGRGRGGRGSSSSGSGVQHIVLSDDE